MTQTAHSVSTSVSRNLTVCPSRGQERVFPPLDERTFIRSGHCSFSSGSEDLTQGFVYCPHYTLQACVHHKHYLSTPLSYMPLSCVVDFRLMSLHCTCKCLDPLSRFRFNPWYNNLVIFPGDNPDSACVPFLDHYELTSEQLARLLC